MSKVRSSIVILIIISLILCAGGGTFIAAADTINDTSVYGAVDNSPDTVKFKDMYLKILIRQKINKPVGKILKSDVAKITELNLANQGLTTINDLSNFPNLTTLYLENNKISDLTPLTGLKKLTKLKLSKNNISKIAPLAGLTKLTSLYLDNNQISDLSVLSKLTALKCLYLKNNKTTDYSAVSVYYKNIKDKDFNISVAPPKPAIKVSYNGKAIALDGAPSVISGKTMVSLKPLLTALGYKYTYTAKTKTISAVKGKLKLALKVDSADGTFNGKKIKLDYSVKLVKTMQYGPVKSLCEKLGYKVISSTTYV
ncbi:MAG: leucine-rich repeat domain-containing protein, partial [Bacteroidota bacterium]|nr:leucine-rich repeat domain-containing protein [Bacteroidota bacterium]